MSTSNSAGRTGRGVNQTVALVFGAIYLLVGVLGFFVTTDVGFASTQGDSLLGFEVNPLHNIVHLLVGAVLVLGSRTLVGARSANLAVGVVYLLVGLIGLFIASDDNPLNNLALHGLDIVLHLGTAIILLAVALGADKTARRGASV